MAMAEVDVSDCAADTKDESSTERTEAVKMWLKRLGFGAPEDSALKKNWWARIEQLSKGEFCTKIPSVMIAVSPKFGVS